MASRKFRKVESRFWQDGFVVELTPEEKFFYLHILTNSKANQLGCYELPFKVIEMETGYNKETVGKLINRFVEYGKIYYDYDTCEILVWNWWKYNWGKSPSIRECCLSEIREIKSKKFVKLLTEKMVQIEYMAPESAQVQKSAEECSAPVQMCANECNAPQENLENTTKTEVSEHCADTVSTDRGEEERRKKKEYICANAHVSTLEVMFDEFYQAYPKKRNRQKALQSFKKLKPSGELFAVMMAMLVAWKQSEEWQKDGGQFIPLPSSWLNGKRWEDEIAIPVVKQEQVKEKSDDVLNSRKASMGL